MKRALIAALIVAFAAASCKKTVESEQKSWENNLKRVSQLTFEFPSFTNVLKEQIETATKVMNESAAITDEKARIQKMAEANSQLMTTFVRNLEEIKSLKTKIRSKVTDVRGLKTQYNEMMMANQAISDSERVIYDSESKLRNTVIESRMDAEALTGLVLADMTSADSNLQRIISMVNERQDAEKQKIEEAQKQQIEAKAEKEKAATPIKCTYCGTLNPADATTCKGCGAPLK